MVFLVYIYYTPILSNQQKVQEYNRIIKEEKEKWKIHHLIPDNQPGTNWYNEWIMDKPLTNENTF